MGLASADPGVEEHGILSGLLETGVGFDGLNVSELLCFEMLARRYQVWEGFYKNELRQSNANASLQGAMEAEERYLFLGQRYGRGAALVCPELEAHVAEVLKERCAIQKEKRKARESWQPFVSPQALAAAAKPKARRGKMGEYPAAAAV